MLRELNRRHELIFISLCAAGCDQRVLKAASEYSRRQVWIPWKEARKGSFAFYAELARNLLSKLPYVIEKYRSPQMTKEIQRLQTELRPELVLCDCLPPAVNFISNGAGNTRTLLSQHNVESVIWKRLYENANGPTRVYFRQQWQRLEAFERDACRRFDGVVGVSAEDCDLMRRQFGLSNVLGDVPTGVDTSFYAPMRAEPKPHSLVFLGSMDWMANIDSVCWFAEAILPLVREKYANAMFTIVGRKPAPRVLQLAQRYPGIRVTGTVDDVRPFLAESQVMVVPLRIGGGTRIKIFEAMAMGIPVVSTRIGAEGLPVTDQADILLADTPEDFARAILDLFSNAQRREQIGRNGLALVRGGYSWERITRIFESYCESVVLNSKEVQ